MISEHPYTKEAVNVYTASLMALIAYGAQGDTAAITQNSAGGMFHLTDEPSKEGYRAFVVNVANMSVLEGVWTWDDTGICVIWSTGDKRHYPVEVWKANLPVLNRIREREAKKRQEGT